jgi:hypothetical protein
MTLDPRLWLLVSSLLFGLGFAWLTRWKPQARRLKSWVVPMSLNLAAMGLLGSILLAGNRPDNLAHAPLSWGLEFALAFSVSFLASRFPRAVGLPLALVAGLLVWQVAGELEGYVYQEGLTYGARTRLLAQTPQARNFELRVEKGEGRVAESLETLAADGWPLPQVESLEIPDWFPVTNRHWFRVVAPSPRAVPVALVPSSWQKTVSIPAVTKPQPFLPYRLVLGPGAPSWQPETPLLAP